MVAVNTSVETPARRQAGVGQGVLVVLAGFLPILAIVALSPAVPKIMERFGAVPGVGTLVPLLVTAPGLMIALTSPLMGWVVDRYGRRRLLLWATAIYGFLGIAPYFLDDLKLIIASRLALGVAEAGILTVTNTLIGDYFAHDQRRTWLTIQGLVGPVFGTSVVALSGYMTAMTWNASFLIYAVAFPIFLAMIVYIYEPVVAAAATGPGAAKVAFPWADVVITSLVTLFSASLYYVYIVQVGLAFGEVGVSSPQTVGLLISIASIGVFLGAALFQWLSGRFTGPQQILAFLLLLGVGLVGIGIAGDQTTMTAAAFVQQLGAGIAIPALVLWSVSKLPAERRGRGMGVWAGCFFLGQFTSPLFVTAAKGVAGTMQGAFGVLGGAALAGALIALACVLRGRRGTP
ncbi:MFS transporter [Nitrospirillum pindoramense]|uniref:Putative MFS family arabinose efflux permease n=1 Tax=Nitrospirillum amazonense TaxID=28077 RepID=A0A560H2R2_9PROT|nr:MFS transporter [Nitrospirillum amazonense]TWB40605.1 putative MFS family arabinose efflux permease [Nitrospirillum amazonense]